MSDVAVYESSIDWTVKPPAEIKPGGLFTVVARFDGLVEPQVFEAYIPDKSGGTSERFLGICAETSVAPNDDGKSATYVWFNICAKDRGKVEVRFRLTWKRGYRLYGGLESFCIKVCKDAEPLLYRTDEQDLLSLLEPRYYMPTPIEEMNARA
ncbi:hypothetical protein F4803DRAFT_548249 [Xylaria telfairii]|nr:hypothetical protein F4803DRAFT_548249 [Xylaria telfairii]